MVADDFTSLFQGPSPYPETGNRQVGGEAVTYLTVLPELVKEKEKYTHRDDDGKPLADAG